MITNFNLKLNNMSFELPLLNYNTNSLEPHIDTRTMEIHHGKHHAGYTNNLNNAIKGTDFENSSIEDILTGLDLNNSAVRNNGGGYFNHSLFWNVMSPDGGGEPSGELAAAIESSFGSFEEFKAQFSKAAGTRFGNNITFYFTFLFFFSKLFLSFINLNLLINKRVYKDRK